MNKIRFSRSAVCLVLPFVAMAAEYEGILFPYTQIVLSTLSTGVVTSLPCREGQNVKEGSILLALDSRKDSLNLLLAQRKMERSQIEKTNEIENAIDVQLKEIACAEKVLRAPWSGTIVSLMVKKQEYYPAGSKAFELADLSRLITEIHVPAADLQLLLHGKVSLKVVRQEQQIKAEVYSHNPLAEPGVELYLVRISFLNKFNWSPGTTVKIAY